MPLQFKTATYGRQTECRSIFTQFRNDHNLLMMGPRRLGKTFVLERLEDRAPDENYSVVRLDVSDCTNEDEFFKALCNKITKKIGPLDATWENFRARLTALIGPGQKKPQNWFEGISCLESNQLAEAMILKLAEDKVSSWAVLIDELPVFLLNMHRVENGLARASTLCYHLRRLREEIKAVSWLITGSIGHTPLARQGNYLGAFNNMYPFTLNPLEFDAACDLLQAWASEGYLHHRRTITTVEAKLLVRAVGWRSAFYLYALTSQMKGDPTEDKKEAHALVEGARSQLLSQANLSNLDSWPEHIRKNYEDPRRSRLFSILQILAGTEHPLTTDGLLPQLKGADIGREECCRCLNILEEDGFIIRDDNLEKWRFRMELLRLWWKRYLPEAA